MIREAVKKAHADAQAILQEAEARQKELVGQKSQEAKKAVDQLKASAAQRSGSAVKAILAIASGMD